MLIFCLVFYAQGSHCFFLNKSLSQLVEHLSSSLYTRKLISSSGNIHVRMKNGSEMSTKRECIFSSLGKKRIQLNPPSLFKISAIFTFPFKRGTFGPYYVIHWKDILFIDIYWGCWKNHETRCSLLFCCFLGNFLNEFLCSWRLVTLMLKIIETVKHFVLGFVIWLLVKLSMRILISCLNLLNWYGFVMKILTKSLISNFFYSKRF